MCEHDEALDDDEYAIKDVPGERRAEQSADAREAALMYPDRLQKTH